MGREHRRRTGAPAHSLERVHQLATARLIQFTIRARNEARSVFPQKILNTTKEIRTILCSLTCEEWKFAEEDPNGWVDVYRVEKFKQLYWVKIKIEPGIGRDEVIVISFHEWNDTIPT